MTLSLAVALTLLACGDPAQEAADPCAGAPTLSADGAALTFTLDGCGSLELTARPLGDGDLSVALAVDGQDVTATVTADEAVTLEGVLLEGTWSLEGDSPARLWRQGYQSWAWAGVTALEPIVTDDARVPLSGADSADASFLDDTAFSSWWVGLLGRQGGASLLAGALESERFKFTASFDEDRAVLAWGGRGERVALAGGEQVTLGTARLALGGDPWGMHRDYARAVAEDTPARPLTDAPVVGWATWYQFYTEIDEPLVMEQLETAASLAADASLAPFDLFQIDDGWQRAWGDWTAGEHFPSGTAALARAIDDAGFTPGIWMAPLYVDRASDLYAAHPDWWVRGYGGDELSYDGFSGWDYAVLDATHPEAAAWLDQLIAEKVAEGWRYLKLDFLFAGAQEGLRYEDVTGLEAYHRAMSIMREAAGDVWILACGAPMLPSVGYAESFRTGADIAFELSTEPALPYLRWQARASAGRSWTNGIWWWNDADQILVREPFDDDEATGSVVANAASGGVWILGDDLVALPDARRSLVLDPKLVALRGSTARPLYPLAHVSGVDAGPIVEELAPDDDAVSQWVLESGEVLLLNMGDDELLVPGPGGVELITGEEAPPGPRALPPGRGEVWRP